MKKALAQYWHALLDLAYPDPCRACGTALLGNEEIICTKCRIGLPRTESHRIPVESLTLKFAGKVTVQNVYAFLKFERQGKVQRLLHQLKYNNQPEVGRLLGRLYGSELGETGVGQRLDLMLPVPLHLLKQAQRGYNQSDAFAEGLSQGLDVPWSNEVLVRSKFTETQTGKNRAERFENVAGIFEVTKPQLIENQRVAVVDDVMTTGSTLESVIAELLQNKAASVTVITLAAAE